MLASDSTSDGRRAGLESRRGRLTRLYYEPSRWLWSRRRPRRYALPPAARVYTSAGCLGVVARFQVPVGSLLLALLVFPPGSSLAPAPSCRRQSRPVTERGQVSDKRSLRFTEADRRRSGALTAPRLLPVDEDAERVLKRRTLTNLYNERPAWLANLHQALDAAVFAAYGWPEAAAPGESGEEELLSRLLALNLARVGRSRWGRPNAITSLMTQGSGHPCGSASSSRRAGILPITNSRLRGMHARTPFQGGWLPSRDSNPDHRLQRPVCYRYTTRQWGGGGEVWCRRPDSNRHGLNAQRCLRPLRLPIPPLRLLLTVAPSRAPGQGWAAWGCLERKTRVELATSSLARRRSTTELLPRVPRV